MSRSRLGVHPVHARRVALGISQEELALRAGVSRSQISAVERRALAPSVGAALRIANALGATVEELFGDSAAPGIEKDAATAGIAPGTRLAWDTRRLRRRLVGWEPTLAGAVAHDVVVDEGGPVRRSPASASRPTLVLAGCDPAAALLREKMAGVGVRVLPLLRSSTAALESLSDGLADVAGVHLGAAESKPSGARTGTRPGRPRLRDEARSVGFVGEGDNSEVVRRVLGSGYGLVRLACWNEGLALRSKRLRGLGSFSAARLRHLRWVAREPGSGARECLDSLVAEAGLTLRPRRLAFDHRMTASLVKGGWGDAGVCCELAAAEAGLDFLSIRREAYDLCFRLEDLERPEVAALLRVLRGKDYRRILGDLPGYETSETGEMVGVT